MVSDAGTGCWWLESCGDDLTPRPPLHGSLNVDVAIVGAGYGGLWTAYYLLQHAPALRVALLERQIAGSGAAGRNGGWCDTSFPVPPRRLAEHFGEDAARAVQAAMDAALDAITRVCDAEGIDAQLVRGGALSIAADQPGKRFLEDTWRDYAALGLDTRFQRLDAGALDRCLRVRGAVAGLRNLQAATIQPARLARGLARAVERRGGVIWEGTPVAGWEGAARGTAPCLWTERGSVRARAIVLAGESSLSRWPDAQRHVLPVASYMVVTEPLGGDLWRAIGWEGHEALGISGRGGLYLQRTRDGRIAVGGGGTAGGEPTRAFDALRQRARDTFPALAECGAQFTHSWSGCFALTRDGIPTMRFDRQTGLGQIGGYGGFGIVAANLAGHTLADLILERDTPLTHLALTTHRSPDWEPEPAGHPAAVR